MQDEYIDVVFTVGGSYRFEIPKGNKTKDEIIAEARLELDAALESINEENLDLDLNLMANEPDIDWEEE